MSRATGRHFLQVPGSTNVPGLMLPPGDFNAVSDEALADARTARRPAPLLRGREPIIDANQRGTATMTTRYVG